MRSTFSNRRSLNPDRSQPRCQLPTQVAERCSHARFHGFYRHALHFRDLSVRESVTPAEEEAFANRLAQWAHSIAYRGIELADTGRYIRRRCFKSHRFVANNGLESPDIAVVPDRIERAIPHCPE